jgi:hypothetical protein
MDSPTFLAHARSLANQGSPAECRSAISRAYYAVYHEGVAFLLALRVVVPAAGRGHVAVSNAILSVPSTLDAPIQLTGRELSLLQSERSLADYRWQDPRTEQPAAAQASVQRAQRILQALSTCAADPARMTALEPFFRTWVPTHGSHLGLTLVP